MKARCEVPINPFVTGNIYTVVPLDDDGQLYSVYTEDGECHLGTFKQSMFQVIEEPTKKQGGGK